MTTHSKISNPTINDIAEACGVSKATVSYVINGKRVLKSETREKVHLAMREMNYHPSAVARGLSSKRVHTIGVLFVAPDPVESITNAYASGILHGVLTQAQHYRFNVTLFTEAWEDAIASARPLADGRTDGILVVAPPLTSDVLRGLSSLTMPIVAVAAGKQDGMVTVDVDNYAGSRLAAEHLLQLGHRRVAYLTGNDDMADYKPRYAGFCDALRGAGVEIVPEFIQLSHLNGSLAFDQTIRLLSHPEPPTAICAGNDAIALAVIEAARSAGVSIPAQLSVVGFDDIPSAAIVAPGLTTIRQPLTEIGATATRLLIERVRQPDGAGDQTPEEQTGVTLAAELIVRDSTAPVCQPQPY